MSEVHEMTNAYRDVLSELETLNETWLEYRAGGRDMTGIEAKIKEREAELRRCYRKVRKAEKRAAKAAAE